MRAGEGEQRSFSAGYAHSLAMAHGFLYETMTLMMIARDLGYVASCDDFDKLANEIGSMPDAMLKKFGVLHSSSSPSFFT